jgi:hypothetical protein
VDVNILFHHIVVTLHVDVQKRRRDFRRIEMFTPFKDMYSKWYTMGCLGRDLVLTVSR